MIGYGALEIKSADAWDGWGVRNGESKIIVEK
jgi:hypothetical protein